MPFVDCLLFGALISPTDPIAVLGILKNARAPKSLEVVLAGEALLNDGIGVVVFMVLLKTVATGQEVSLMDLPLFFVQEVLGGIFFGLAIGWLAFKMLKSVDNYQVEVLITLALVMGGYALVNTLHASGPLAMVVAGLLIGNHGRSLAMSAVTREHLDAFWELIDEILNAVLFLLIGLEVLALKFTAQYLCVGLTFVPVVLLARWISVAASTPLFPKRPGFCSNIVKILIWGGLRGGISVALALSIPSGPARGVVLAITYTVVVFSIIVQGLTIGRLIRREQGLANG